MSVRAVTSGELDLLRANGHFSKLYLAFLTPPSVYTAELDAVPASNDEVAEITYINGSGTLADVRVGMTMYVGTTAGAFDLGMVRIRKTPTVDTFYIGEQSRVLWDTAGTIYLTVVEDFELWAKHVKIVDEVIYMDYDLTFSDQYTDFKPVPVLGSHRVAKLTGATVDVNLGPASDEASWVIGSSISSVLWTIPDATVITTATSIRPVATFNSVGWHACYCTVTAANGKTATGIRWVYIYDDNNMPSEVFELRNWQESYDYGGINCTVVMGDDASLADIRKRSLCILFTEDFYGIGGSQVQQSVGQVEYAENVRFIGRVGDEDFHYDAQSGTVTFELNNHRQFFEMINTFPTGVRIAKNTPALWTDFPSLTVDKGLWFLLEYRSTATIIMDIILTGDSRYSPEVSAYTGSLWEQMKEFVFSQIRGNIHIDAYGHFYAELDPQIIPEADRSTDIPTVMTLTGDDIASGIEVDLQEIPETSLIDASGMALDASGKAYAFFALSPGHVFDQFGSPEVVDRLLLADQAECTQLAGLLLGWKQNRVKGITIEILGNNNMISCFPNQYVVFTVNASDTPRGEAITGNFIPRSRNVTFNNKDGVFAYRIVFEYESFEQPAIAYIPPAGDDFSIPPLPPFPPIPVVPPIYFGDDSATDRPSTVMLLNSYSGYEGLIYSLNFDEPDVNDIVYQFGNGGLTSTQKTQIASMFVTPSGAVYLFRRTDRYTAHDPWIARAPSLGGLFTTIVDSDWLAANDPHSCVDINAVGFDPNYPDRIAFVTDKDAGGISSFHLCDGGTGFSIGGVTLPNVDRIGDLTFADGTWIWTGEVTASASRLERVTADGSTIINGWGAGSYMFFQVRGGQAKRTYVWGPVSNTIRRYDLFDNPPFAYSHPTGTVYSLECNTDGQILMSYVLGAVSKVISTDFGASWNALSALPVSGNYKFRHAGASKWLAVSGYVQWTENNGGSWTSMVGNMPYVVPFLSLYNAYFPGINVHSN